MNIIETEHAALIFKLCLPLLQLCNASIKCTAFYNPQGIKKNKKMFMLSVLRLFMGLDPDYSLMRTYYNVNTGHNNKMLNCHRVFYICDSIFQMFLSIYKT